MKQTEQEQKPKKKLNEKDVTKQVLDWAAVRGESVRLFRMQTTGIPDGKGGFRFNSEKGAPDFIGVYLMAKIPVLFAFEIKSPTGRQSESQKKWQEKAEGFGIQYFIIKSWEDAESATTKIHNQHRQKISWSYLGPQFPEFPKIEASKWANLTDSAGGVKRTTKASAVKLQNETSPNLLQQH